MNRPPGGARLTLHLFCLYFFKLISASRARGGERGGLGVPSPRRSRCCDRRIFAGKTTLAAPPPRSFLLFLFLLGAISFNFFLLLLRSFLLPLLQKYGGVYADHALDGSERRVNVRTTATISLYGASGRPACPPESYTVLVHRRVPYVCGQCTFGKLHEWHAITTGSLKAIGSGDDRKQREERLLPSNTALFRKKQL